MPAKNIFDNNSYTACVFSPTENFYDSKMLPVYRRINKILDSYDYEDITEQNVFKAWLKEKSCTKCLPNSIQYALNLTFPKNDIDCLYIDNLKFLSHNVDNDLCYIGLYISLSVLSSNDLNILNLLLNMWCESRFFGQIKIESEQARVPNINEFRP